MSGIQFPLLNGKRSTLEFNKQCWINSLENCENGRESQQRIQRERNFRFRYGTYVEDHLKHCVRSKEQCIEMSANALEFVHDNIEFQRDNETFKLRDTLKNFSKPRFSTSVIVGKGKRENASPFSIPYKGRNVEGKEIMKLMKYWSRKGICEKDCLELMKFTINEIGEIDLSNKYFVLLGATSAMGPFELLMQFGGNIVAIARSKKSSWEKMINTAKESCGKLYVPTKRRNLTNEDEIASSAGCDLIQETPEIFTWLNELDIPEGSELIFCNFTYGDGQLFVKLSIACDFLMKSLEETKKDTHRLKFAFYGSPGNVHLVSHECHRRMKENFDSSPLYQKLLYLMFKWKKGFLEKNEKSLLHDRDGKEYPYCYGIGVTQGPNYLLAKRIQNWRCCLLLEKGYVVSTNMAPATKTESVTHSWKLKAYVEGIHHCWPIETFDEKTSRNICFGLLFADLFNYDPGYFELENPLLLFERGSFHSGIWNSGFQAESFGVMALAFYYFGRIQMFVLSLLVSLVILAFLYSSWMVVPLIAVLALFLILFFENKINLLRKKRKMKRD